MIYELAIVGVGASGLMCATLAPRGTVILDHNSEIGRKLLLTGGGKCNFSNRQVTAQDYFSQNPSFCRSALARFRPDDFLSFIEEDKIPYEERDHGKLFAFSSETIRQLLFRRAASRRVEWKLNCEVKSAKKNGEIFQIATNQGVIEAKKLVIATGGLSFASVGASGIGYEIAQFFGHSIVPCSPALVPLEWDENSLSRFHDLAGISVEVEIATEKRKIKEAILFTHNGISGPAALKISLFWQEGNPVTITFIDEKTARERLDAGRKNGLSLLNAFSGSLPQRLLRAIFGDFAVQKIAQLSKKNENEILNHLLRWSYIPSKSAGYKRAEVTRGGVDTREISSSTMESKLVPGLYFIGEVLDVTGLLGGYNLHWAWASAHAAGLAISHD